HIALVAMFFDGITSLPTKDRQGNLPCLVGIDGIDLHSSAPLGFLPHDIAERLAACQPEQGHGQSTDCCGSLPHVSLLPLGLSRYGCHATIRQAEMKDQRFLL